MSQQKEWKTLSSEVGFQGKFLKVRVDKVRRPDGSIGAYEVVEKPDFVIVIPKTGDKFYLVEQYRYAVGECSWEFPQGGCEGEPNLETCAKRELEEEIGLKATRLTLLGNIWLAVGSSTQGCSIYLAEQLSPGKKQLDASEADLVTSFFTLQEIEVMIRKGIIRSSITIAAFSLYQLQKNPKD